MTTNDDITKGADGVWRHASGRPASFALHQMLARAEGGRGLTAAATASWSEATARWPKSVNGLSPTVAALVKKWRAEAAGKKLKPARALLAVEALERAGTRDSLAWRAAAARASLRAVDLRGRNVSIRETANWKKR